MLRQFTDAKGVAWRVWDVWPSGSGSAQNPAASQAPLAVFPGESLSGGWLCFECDDEKRRLAPIPLEWETCESCVLEEMCARAGYVTRTPRDSRSVRPERPAS